MTEEKPLRICVLSKQFPPGVGGAETYAYELADGLGRRGYDVDVYTQWVDDPDENVDINENVTVHRICKARKKFVTFETLWFSFKARRYVDLEQYDIIHGTLMPASTVAITPFNNVEVPIVVTSHGTSISETKAVALETPADYLMKFFFHPMNVVMDTIAGNSSDAIIAISDHAREELLNRYDFAPERVHMIPHGVDTETFLPQENPHPAVSQKKVTLLYVGRLGARKGLDLAMQALELIEEPEIEFLIAGTGRHERHLRKLAEQLGVSHQVEFLGYVPDEELPALYSAADALVLPSRYEGFGLVLLEAVACGTPVIGTDVGGIPTAIDDDFGIVVKREVGTFAEALRSITDNDRRYQMEKTAIETREKISWQRMIDDVTGLYAEILNS